MKRKPTCRPGHHLGEVTPRKRTTRYGTLLLQCQCSSCLDGVGVPEIVSRERVAELKRVPWFDSQEPAPLLEGV